MSRRGLLAMIHIAKKALHLDEETYRATLEHVAGRSSAGTCTDAELSRVVDHFRRLGWSPTPSRKVRAPSRNAHVRKVWALWADLIEQGAVRSPTREALRAFVRRMTGVADPEWLGPREANVVVEGLKAWAVRHQAQREAQQPGEPIQQSREGSS